jgi:hypothetical protein
LTEIKRDDNEEGMISQGTEDGMKVFNSKGNSDILILDCSAEVGDAPEAVREQQF